MVLPAAILSFVLLCHAVAPSQSHCTQHATMSSSGAFRNYQRSYSSQDSHLEIFRKLCASFSSQSTNDAVPRTRVLYPGCHRHITPSLVFQDITYVDMDHKVSDVFDDRCVKQWVTKNKEYVNDASWSFICSSYKDTSKHLEVESFDILISMSAGIVSKDCMGYLKQGGIFLVNDSHSDAKVAFLEPSLLLEAYYDEDEWITCPEKLNELFLVEPRSKKLAKQMTCPTKITKEQVEEAIRIGSKSKRSFVMKKEPMFYVFRKRHEAEENVSDDNNQNTARAVDDTDKKSTRKRIGRKRRLMD